MASWEHGFQYWFQNRKVNKVRGIAIKALKIFQGYAKKKQTFDMVASEFNNKIDIVEKRAVLVGYLSFLGLGVLSEFAKSKLFSGCIC